MPGSLGTEPNIVVFLWIKLKWTFSFVILKGITENHKFRKTSIVKKVICSKVSGYQSKNSLDKEEK